MPKPKLIIRETADGRRFRRLVKQLQKGPHVKEGYPSENRETKEQHDNSEVTNLLIALVHEFGTQDGHVPQRSHVRSSFDENRPKLERFTTKLAGRVIDGSLTLEQALDQAGLFMLDGHKKKIQSSIPPPNAPSTVAAKGSSKTLIDTAQMLNSATIKRIMK